MLIQYGYLWDAEIMMRPIMEATLRVAFLSFASDEEQVIRCREFWDELPDIERLKQSQRARISVQRMPEGPNSYDFIRNLILSPEEEETLRKEWPGKRRKALEQKWSFSEIMRSLEVSQPGLSIAQAATHNYGLSSHLIHADFTGVSIPIDRDNREPDERRKLIRAHSARLLGDEIHYIALISLSVAFGAKRDRNLVVNLLREAQPFLTQLEKIGDEFYDHLKPESLS
jgi:hypothetical protein